MTHAPASRSGDLTSPDLCVLAANLLAHILWINRERAESRREDRHE
jgi:hypothetical protein